MTKHVFSPKEQENLLAYGERLEELSAEELIIEARSNCTALGIDKMLVGELANRLETLLRSATLERAA